MTSTPAKAAVKAPASRTKKKTPPGDRARDSVLRLMYRIRKRRREERLAYRSAFADGMRASRRKRKAALALSASVMGFSTAATVGTPVTDVRAQHTLTAGVDYRAHASKLHVSDAMHEAMAEEEGVRLTVYRDVAGYPTVGIGHLVTPKDGLKVGDRITYDQAIDFLERDIKTAEEAVVRLVGELSLYQHEFDALVDLVYNVGEGNVSKRESPRLNQAIAKSDYDGMAAEMHYHHAGGAKAKGLIYRSERRSKIFMDAAYENPRPSAQGWSSSA